MQRQIYAHPEPQRNSAPDEVCRLAQNLARNCGYPCFPVSAKKIPTIEAWPERASKDFDALGRLWQESPGPLLGVLTGTPSGNDVLDVDIGDDHPKARAWLDAALPYFPPTRCYATRRGGRHYYWQHAAGVRNSCGKLADGVDVRGDGGFIIFWYAAGFECIDHAPPAPWPAWLLDVVLWKRPSPPAPPVRQHRANADKAIDGVLRTVATAREGTRNGAVFWAAHRLRERITAGQIGRGDALGLLTAAGQAAGLPADEISRTVGSAWRG